ncbi:MAG: hypothetical protein U0074_00120 [Kouleothrix sp.]
MLMLVPLGMFRVWGERKLTLRALAGLCTALSAAGAALARRVARLWALC